MFVIDTDVEGWWRWALGALGSIFFVAYWRLTGGQNSIHARLDAMNARVTSVETGFSNADKRRIEDRDEERAFRNEIKHILSLLSAKMDQIADNEREEFQQEIRELKSQLRDNH